jgi:thiosulfate/3-mercaptopyruvate sulfurtransferase
MSYTLLISALQLQQLQANQTPLVVFDCSFDLMNPATVDATFAQEHITGAQQAHLDRHLSAHDASHALNGGRHPLPRAEAVAQWLGQCGVHEDTQVVVYDRNGNNYCGRLWWMLKWLGHDAVAILDGGLQAWKNQGGAIEQGIAKAAIPRMFEIRPALRQWLSTDDVRAQMGEVTQTLVDARGAPRYRGEVEPLDPIAGHIPGALNRPFTDNFDAQGCFKSPEALRQEWTEVLAGCSPESVVHHCGSGVSAVPNIVSMELAGLGVTRLYAGSWSEWSRTPGLPCEKS